MKIELGDVSGAKMFALVFLGGVVGAMIFVLVSPLLAKVTQPILNADTLKVA